MPITCSRNLASLASIALIVALSPSIASVSPAAAADSVTTQGLPAAPPPAVVDGLGELPSRGAMDVSVQLPQEPAVLTWRHADKAVRAKAGRDQKAKIDEAQRGVRAAIGRIKGARVIYSVDSAYNGIAVHVDRDQARALLSIPGVSAVRRLIPVTTDNSPSDELIGAPETWASGSGLTGAGIRIGIIDTGIDYVHSDFGGSQNYAANPDHTQIGDSPDFPSAKVVGGYDFAGDSYNGYAMPQPDPDPMDCNGHGSHVAGTAAGYGENGDGSTYRGAYDPNIKLTAMKIGPGVAPGAQLYALRVFGCSGGTYLVTQAIDWAMDPNRDGDFSDHLDVVNMSLGSSFGSPDNPDAVAAGNAAFAGVQVVISAGNAGPQSYVTGSPGVAPRALTVASSTNAARVQDLMTFTPDGGSLTRYPGTNSSAFNWSGVSDVTAPLYVPNDRIGCAAFTGADAAAAVGHVLLLDLWSAAATCDSAVRVTNAAAAGAVGVIFIDRGTAGLTGSLAGTVTLPSFLITRSSGDTLLALVPPGSAGGLVTLGCTPFGQGPLIDSTADALSSFSSRGPAIGNALKPDIAAPGGSVVSVASGTGDGAVSFQGTSMAAPHMSGTMALLKQLHPTWTVEELKALAMNTAGQDLFSQSGYAGNAISPVAGGSGRVKLLGAIASDVVAYNTDSPGAVSVSFGALQVLGTQTAVRTVALVNHGATDMTYDVSMRRTTPVPGVRYDLPDGPSVTVPAGGSATVRLQLTAVASLMDNTADVNLGQSLYKTALSEDAGLLTFTPAAGVPLRVAYLAVVRPASAMAAIDNVGFTSSAPGTTSLHLDGTPLATGDRPYLDDNAIVTPLMLGGTSPRDPALAAAGDLAAVGSAVAGDTLVFGIQTYGARSLPTDNETEFNINLDVNNDGQDDFVLYNTRYGDTDVYVSSLYEYSTRSDTVSRLLNLVSTSIPTAIQNSSVLTLGVRTARLGMTGTTLRYSVDSYPSGVAADHVGPFSFDVAAPALDFSGGASSVAYTDSPSTTIPVAYNPSAWAAQGQPSVLLLHHFNLPGAQAQIVPAGPAVTSIDVSPSPLTLAKGTTQQLTATALLLNGTHQDVTSSATWTSDSANATVDAAGIVTAASLGSATVTAAYNGGTGSTAVSIGAATLSALAVTPAITSLAKGTTQQYVATGTFSDGTTQDLSSGAIWTTDDLSIATVDSAGLLTAAGVGSANVTATATASSHAGSAAVTVTPAVLRSIVVTPTSPSIAKGTTVALTATGVYSDASTQDLTTTASWLSATSSIASVDTTGLVTGQGEGASTVSAVHGGITGSTQVTVTPAVITSIAVTPANPNLPAGTDQQLVATATFTDASIQDVSSLATWTSGTPAYATISATTGLLHAVAPGATHVTAAWSGVTGATNATVTPAALRAIAVTPAAASLAAGTTLQYTATGTYTDGSTRDDTTAVTWGSSTPAASASNAAGSKGLITGLVTGPATISAASGAISGATGLTVTAALLRSVAVTPQAPSLVLGVTLQLTATGTYSDGSHQNLTSSASWTSSAPAVISVSPAGVATANASSGNATIQATVRSLSDTTLITARPVSLSRITVTPANPSAPKGTQLQFIATGNYTNGTSKNLTTTVMWRSSGAAANIGNGAPVSGRANAIDIGTVTISATLGTVVGTTTLTVTPAVLRALSVTPNSSKLQIGTSRQYVATGTYTDGTTSTLTSSVTWSVTGGITLSASTPGYVTAVRVSTASVTANTGAFSAKVTFSVTR